MAGLLPGQAVMQVRLAGLGPQGWADAAGELRGHAFHYSRLESDVAPLPYHKQPSGAAGEAIYRSAR